MTIALFALAGYLAGSLPFGYWTVRVTKGADIRSIGSGNIGATNVWRTYGWRYGLPVALLDVAKGFAPALAATIVVGHLAGVAAGAAAMLGHWRPLFLGFAKGGKMVVAAGSLPALAFALGYPWPVIAFAGAAGAAVTVLHRANIRRLLAGTENRATLRRRGPTARAAPSS